MSQSLVYLLLCFALMLPILGAITLRLLGSRLAPVQLYSAAAGLLVVVLASVLLLERSDVPSLQIGSLSVLLPVTAPEDIGVAVPVPDVPATGATLEEPTAGSEQTPLATSASTVATASAAPIQATSEAPPGAAATATPSAAPTSAPAATAAPTTEPTATPTAEPTAAPTAAPTVAPPPASAPQKYTVQAGDTLRSIAEKFKISVTALIEANKLTPQQADSLRVGQELVIPAP